MIYRSIERHLEIIQNFLKNNFWSHHICLDKLEKYLCKLLLDFECTFDHVYITVYQLVV